MNHQAGIWLVVKFKTLMSCTKANVWKMHLRGHHMATHEIISLLTGRGGGGGEHKIEENKKRQRENISKQTDADAAKSGRKKCSEKSARKQR